MWLHTHLKADATINSVNKLSSNHGLVSLGFQLVAVVMDLLTDLQILQDLLDAASKRGVAVYLLLEENGLPHFLDMSSRLQISTQHLRVSENN